MNHDMPHKPYRRLLLMAFLSFLSMYVLMYMMVDSIAHVFPNVNQFYMAGMMTAPMIIIELALMGTMYPNKQANAALVGVSVLAGILFIVAIRMQVGVTDKQLVKSMIPHHASAILMCEEAPLQDPEIQQLCESIIATQNEEIDQMLEKLNQ
jgi:uncharacterized protein (DUF305 family)